MKNPSMFDPGTISSDQELEISDDSDKDEMEVDEEAESFFCDLPDENPYEMQKKKKEGIEKYMKCKKMYNLDSTIQSVREKIMLRLDEMGGSVDKGMAELEDPIKPPENVENVSDRVKYDQKQIKLKEKKLQKALKESEGKTKKEEEEFGVEEIKAEESDFKFEDMHLSPPLLKAVAELEYRKPTPIQAATIPIALKGRDICGCAATGTGKTAAYMLPILQRLIVKSTSKCVTRVLVLVPTRELGVQVFEVSKELTKFTKVSISLAVGGLNMSTQKSELTQNPDIIIATPGRLIDHIQNTATFSLNQIEILVLDEADRMLDEFFAEQLTEIVKQCKISRQTMLFSATMTEKVKDLMAVSLKNPVKVFVNANTTIASKLRQEFIKLKDKKEETRNIVLAYLLMKHFNEECLVFVSTKVLCHRLHIMFGLLGLNCGELHGNLNQNERFQYLQNFKEKKIGVLFATDVAARGLDIKGVKTVVNYTVPSTYDIYIHRVGRTARAGSSGLAITLANQSGDDFSLLRKIRKNSLTPLYERVVKAANLEPYREKMKELDPLCEEVLDKEREDKLNNGQVQNSEKAGEEEGGKEKDKRERIKKLRQKKQKDPDVIAEEMNERKKRLEMILAGKMPFKDLNVRNNVERRLIKLTEERKKKTVKSQTDDVSEEMNNKVQRKEKKAKARKIEDEDDELFGNKKSLFDEEVFLSGNQKAKKKARLGEEQWNKSNEQFGFNYTDEDEGLLNGENVNIHPMAKGKGDKKKNGKMNFEWKQKKKMEWLAKKKEMKRKKHTRGKSQRNFQRKMKSQS